MYLLLYLIDQGIDRPLRRNGDFPVFADQCARFVIFILDHAENGDLLPCRGEYLGGGAAVRFASVDEQKSGRIASLSPRCAIRRETASRMEA